MHAVSWLAGVLIPDGPPGWRVVALVVYAVAMTFAFGGLWAFLSIVLEHLPPFRVRVCWRCIKRETAPLRQLGAALVVPFRRR